MDYIQKGGKMVHCKCGLTGGCELCNPFLLKEDTMPLREVIKMLQEIDEYVTPHSSDIADDIVWEIAKKYGLFK